MGRMHAWRAQRPLIVGARYLQQCAMTVHSGPFLRPGMPPRSSTVPVAGVIMVKMALLARHAARVNTKRSWVQEPVLIAGEDGIVLWLLL